jgi:AcrR family transcriptional regulator
MAKTAEEQSSFDLTREKLIEAAGEVFAEAGFRDATVREICARAGANVAAVNYHFRDKLGLYSEVIKSAIMAQQPVGQNSFEAHGADPRAALSALVHQWMERVRDGGKPAWFARIMAHEMTQPTPALDRVTEAMQPNYLRLRTLVGKLIGRSANDARTRMCVHSVVGQILHYVQSRAMLARLWPDLNLDDAKQRRAIADHIVEFSLAGLKAAHRSSAHKKRKQAPATIRS